MTPAALYARANTAAADAIRYGRQPNGEALASIRRRDAVILRRMASEAIATACVPGAPMP